MHPKWIKHENKDYENYIRKKPCLICGQEGVDLHHVWHARRNCYLSTPLCRGCHTARPDSYHAIEHKEFCERHNINLEWEIIELLSEYIERNL